MVRIIDDFPEPFAIMKIGYEDYDGEEDLWMDDSQDVTHIVVRAAEELERVKESGNLDFYPFGLNARVKRTIEALEEICSSPIDIFFVVVNGEEDDWIEGFPDPDLLKWDDDSDTYTELHLDDEIIYLPHPIRISGDDGDDYGVLLIDDIEYFEYEDRIVLDFDSTGVSHINSGNLIENTFSGRPTFGIFIDDDERTEMNSDYSVDVIARARLVPSYYGVAKP
ncbi:MAG: hypothetical protein ACTSSE_13130 [Candidatus Thorarchaeota archaeon]